MVKTYLNAAAIQGYENVNDSQFVTVSLDNGGLKYDDVTADFNNLVNKPFGEGLGLIIDEVCSARTVNGECAVQSEKIGIELVVGEVYGIEIGNYHVSNVVCSLMTFDGQSLKCLGNAGHVFDGEDDNGLEFFYANISDIGYIMLWGDAMPDTMSDVSDGEFGNVHVKIYGPTIKKIDEKYIPSTIQSDWDETDSQKVSFLKNKPFGEIYNVVFDRECSFYVDDENNVLTYLQYYDTIDISPDNKYVVEIGDFKTIVQCKDVWDDDDNSSWHSLGDWNGSFGDWNGEFLVLVNDYIIAIRVNNSIVQHNGDVALVRIATVEEKNIDLKYLPMEIVDGSIIRNMPIGDYEISESPNSDNEYQILWFYPDSDADEYKIHLFEGYEYKIVMNGNDEYLEECHYIEVEYGEGMKKRLCYFGNIFMLFDSNGLECEYEDNGLDYVLVFRCIGNSESCWNDAVMLLRGEMSVDDYDWTLSIDGAKWCFDRQYLPSSNGTTDYSEIIITGDDTSYCLNLSVNDNMPHYILLRNGHDSEKEVNLYFGDISYNGGWVDAYFPRREIIIPWVDAVEISYWCPKGDKCIITVSDDLCIGNIC